MPLLAHFSHLLHTGHSLIPAKRHRFVFGSASREIDPKSWICRLKDPDFCMDWFFFPLCKNRWWNVHTFWAQAFPRVRERRSGTPARRLSGKAGIRGWRSPTERMGMGDETCAGLMGIIISQYKDPNKPTSVMERHKAFERGAQLARMVPGPSKRFQRGGWATQPRAFWRKLRRRNGAACRWMEYMSMKIGEMYFQCILPE